MKKFVKTTIAALAMVVALSVGAGADVEAAKKVTKVAVSADGLSKKKVKIAKGKSKQLTVKINGKAVKTKKISKNVTLKSKNSKIVKVTKNGKLTAKKVGKTKVTITSKKNKKKKVTITVTVVKKPVKKVTASVDKSTLTVGETAQIKYSVTKKASYKSVSFTSSKKSVATVNKNGKITAKAPGSATITVKALDGSNKKAKVNVTVVAQDTTTPAPTPTPTPTPVVKKTYTEITPVVGVTAEVSVGFNGDSDKVAADVAKLITAAGIKDGESKQVKVNGKTATVVLEQDVLYVVSAAGTKLPLETYIQDKKADGDTVTVTYTAELANAVAAVQLLKFTATGTYKYDVTINEFKATELVIANDGIKITINGKTYNADVQSGVIVVEGDVSNDDVVNALEAAKYVTAKVVEK